MEENTASADTGTAAPPRELKLEDVAGVVADMNRFLTRLGSLPPFADSKLALAEWLVLLAVKETDNFPVKQLSKKFGIVQQRVNQIVDRLKGSELVSVSGSAENPKLEVVSLTESGRTRLEAMNATLFAILVKGLGTSERSLFAVERNLKPLLRMVAQPKAEEQQAESTE